MATTLLEPSVEEEVDESATPWRYRILALTPGTLTGLYLIWSGSYITAAGRRFSIADDAMISMTYARTLARGGGLVWFEGAPRVEGITNPLWTLYMALLHVIGLQGSPAVLVVALTGLATVLVTALAAGRIARKIRPGSRISELAAITTVPLLFTLMYWSAGRGMEVGIIVACTFVATMLAIDYRDSSGDRNARKRQLVLIAACFGIGIATRLDFLPIAAVIVAWMIWTAQSRRDRIQVLASLGLFCFALLAFMTLARLWYYGEIVPNTYTLKATGVPFSEQFARGLLMDIKIIPAVAVAVGAAWFAWSSTSANSKRVLVLVAGVGVIAIAYSTYTGGDAWETIPNRYVQPALVAAAILVASSGTATSRIRERIREIALVAMAVLVLLVIVGGLIAFDRPGLRGSLSGLASPFAMLPLALVAVTSAWLVTRSKSSLRIRYTAPAFAGAAALSAFYLQSNAFHPDGSGLDQVLAAIAMFATVLAGAFGLDRISDTAANRMRVSTLLAGGLLVLFASMALRTETGGTGLNAARLTAVWISLVPVIWLLPPTTSKTRFAGMFRTVALCLALIYVTSAVGWSQWTPGVETAISPVQDIRWATGGDELALLTKKDATIAYTAAGGSAYYADRRAVDLLGKMDEHIAKMDPVAPFWPGHNKFDYRWSIENRRPDVFTQSFVFTGDDIEMLLANGYSCHVVKYPPYPEVWLRDDSPYVDHNSPRIRPC